MHHQLRVKMETTSKSSAPTSDSGGVRTAMHVGVFTLRFLLSRESGFPLKCSEVQGSSCRPRLNGSGFGAATPVGGGIHWGSFF